ncbi:hypothetical protein WMY93_003497 [Mugilogobius chulae]|uniref:A-kinase anchor protein 2 C-terminal domain-containing protein n=1 Tax=Mugilogobius chulae TaxID=88201 RepID=A0AAW0Q2H7_9GOBI
MERSQSITSADPQHVDTECTPYSPTFTAQYYNVMEDDCPDEVFIPPSSLPSRLEPEGGGTCEAAVTDPSVSLRSSDGTEANTNPECLDWPHEEKQLMTSHSTEASTERESVFEEVVRSDSSSGKCTRQDQELQEDRIKIQGSDHSTEEVENSNDDGLFCDQMMNPNVNAELLKEADLLSKFELKHSCQNSERLNIASQMETEENQNTMEVTLKQSSDNSQEEGTNAKLEDALDNEMTGYDWVRRTGVEDDEEALSSEERGLHEQEETAGTLSERRIATEILQGEYLLQRLQLVQQKQDLDEHCFQTPNVEEKIMTEVSVATETIQDNEQEEGSDHESSGSPLLALAAQFENFSIRKAEVVSSDEENDCSHFADLKITSKNVSNRFEQDVSESQKTAVVGEIQQTEECGLRDGCLMEHSNVDEEHICVDEKSNSNNEGDEQDATLSHPQTHGRDIIWIDGSDTFSESRIPFAHCHRLSAAETLMEKQLHESSQIKPDLQRAEGVFDLTENPDRRPQSWTDWHFSEKKMQKEISQEMQRELVLVNLGKIPGEYSKGESRHMKDTKLLFEAFQQEHVEGPTRIRKPQSSLPKSQVYPSVLERTRSLEMFSQKLSPMFRTHSFRLVSTSEKEKHPETFRPLSPSIRDKPRLSPYPKHEKHPRMHKSMDSINMNTSIASGVRGSNKDPPREGSPLLKENPFFKLRPALNLQPEVEKDIREAKKREEELRKQRSSLYGETRQCSKEDRRSTAELKADCTQKTTGRLERVWPPPSKKDPSKTLQQEAKVQRGPGQRTALWQRWESGLINGQSATTNNKN